MLYRAASGLHQVFWAISALLVNGRIRRLGLEDLLLLERSILDYCSLENLLCTFPTGRKEALSLGYFHKVVCRLHVSLWPYVKNDPYTLSVPGRLVCLFQRPHGKEISWWELEGGENSWRTNLEQSENCKVAKVPVALFNSGSGTCQHWENHSLCRYAFPFLVWVDMEQENGATYGFGKDSNLKAI